MKRRFSNNHNATVRRLSAGVADYSERMNNHHATAKQKHDDATVRTGNEVATHWESPRALREWAHENELAEASFQAMLDCGAMLTLAQWSAYRHACYCKARASVARVPVIVAHSLRQVSTQLTALARSVSPPGLMTAPNVLATCQASNAPGLTPNAMNYWQVPARE
jgi:hypothetical protein